MVKKGCRWLKGKPAKLYLQVQFRHEQENEGYNYQKLKSVCLSNQLSYQVNEEKMNAYKFVNLNGEKFLSSSPNLNSIALQETDTGCEKVRGRQKWVKTKVGMKKKRAKNYATNL